MGIESIVNVQITRETASVEQAGFGRALTLSEHTKFPERCRLYSSLTAVADDFDSTDPEYKAAQKYFGQELKPEDLLIGRAEAFVAQVDDIEINTLEAAAYVVTINGTAFTYETQQISSITGTSDGTYQVVDVIINSTTIPWEIQSSPDMALEYEELLGLVNACPEPVTATYINPGDHSAGIYITEDPGAGAFTLSLSGETGTLAAATVTAHGAAPADSSTVANGLMTLINAGSEPVTASLTGSSPDEDLKLTADVAGTPFTTVVSTNLTLVHTTANSGITDNLDAIVASGDLGGSWYALISMYRTETDILAAAAWVESNKKIYIACNDDADVITSATDDVASLLQDAAYARTAFLWSEDEANFPDAACLGRMLPTEPGTATWAFKTLAGITIDELTDTEIAYLKAKNANYYTEVGGVNITRDGKVAEGEWLDVIRGIDWIEARMEENIYSLIVSVDKIPFTNPGIAQVVNQVEQILNQAVTRNILVVYDITVPKAEDFTQAQKQTRTLTGITFTGTLAGAVHAVTITGTVSV